MRGLGRFQLIESLGTGAFGAVFLARDPAAPGQQFALKILHKEGGRARARFQREISACVRLRHPGIVRVFESGEAEGKPYLLMEYVRGQTFERLGTGQRRPSPARAAELARDAADAIAHAHFEGVLHRDLKPGNLLVDEAGRIRVLDFGLASLQDSQERLSVTGLALGTLAYMAPEQARGQRVDERADVFGLGGVLFFLLTGRSPVEDADDPWRALCEGPPPSPAKLNPLVPAGLDAIVRRALAREPDKRYARAEELADALRSFLAGGEEPRARARVAPIVGAAGALLVIGVGGALALSRVPGVSLSEQVTPPAQPTPGLGSPVGGPAPPLEGLAAALAAEPELALAELERRFADHPGLSALRALEKAYLAARAGEPASTVVAAAQAAVSAAEEQPELACFVAKRAARVVAARGHYGPAEAWLAPWGEDAEARFLSASCRLRSGDEAVKQAAQRRLEELGRERGTWGLVAHAMASAKGQGEGVVRAARRAAADPLGRRDARYLEGLGHLRAQRFEAALTCARGEEAGYGADVHDLYLAAACLLQQQALEEAGRLLERARRLSQPVWVPSGVGLHAELLSQLGRHEELIELTQAVGAELSASFWPLHIDALDHLGRFDEAAALARANRQAALELLEKPGNAVRVSRLRRYLHAPPLKGILPPNVAARVRARLEPLSEPARVALGDAVALWAQGARLEDLDPQLKRATTAAPKDPELLLLEAEIELERRETQRALETLDRLAELRRPSVVDVLLRGEVLLRSGQLLGARKLLADLPKEGWAGKVGEAIVAYSTGQADRALEACEAVLAERPRQRQARWLKLASLLKLKRAADLLRCGDRILAEERYMQLTTYYVLVEARLRLSFAKSDSQAIQAALMGVDHILGVAPKSASLALTGAHFVALYLGRQDPRPSQWLMTARSWLSAAQQVGAKPIDVLVLEGALAAAEGGPAAAVDRLWSQVPQAAITPDLRELYQRRFPR